MNKSVTRARLTAVVIAAFGMISMFAGCGKKEEPKPAGYYEGPRQPKGTGTDGNVPTSNSSGAEGKKKSP